MASPYPYELRSRVMLALESKMPVSKIIKIFKICRDTVYKWKNIKEATGDVKAKTGYQDGNHRRKIKDNQVFLEFIKTNEGKTIKDLSLLMKVSPSTIQRSLKRINYTYKKNLLSPQKGYGSEKEVSGRDCINSARKASIS